MSIRLPSFISGNAQNHGEPLGRYLPTIPNGVVSKSLENLIHPTNSGEAPWILDPFGTSPRLIAEAARAGTRVLVTAINPISRFLIKMAASPPSKEALSAGLANLAITRKEGQRLELFINSLYRTTCNECGQDVIADAFIWEKLSEEASPIRSGSLRIIAKILSCSQCGKSGEQPVSSADIDLANEYTQSPLHLARALERVIDSDDPYRNNALETLDVYLPRSLYAVITVINKLLSLNLPVDQQEAIYALILSAFDHTNTMWPYPSGRSRPRSIFTPTKFKETNFWRALEESLGVWETTQTPIEITHWPALPNNPGAVCIYDGRLRELIESGFNFPLSAVLSVFPRPNQAFWSLCAVWAGWLWGREAAAPFISVLHRRRFDWQWHSTALFSVFESVKSVITQDTPVIGLIGECEPNFLSASIVAATKAGFSLSDIHINMETNQTQSLWFHQEPSQFDRTVISKNPNEIIKEAAVDYLTMRNESASYLLVHASVLQRFASSNLFGVLGEQCPQIITKLHSLEFETFTNHQHFTHSGGSDKALDTGQWYLTDPQSRVPALVDRIEKEVVTYLVKHPQSTYHEIRSAVLQLFSGLFTPGDMLTQIIIQSYCDEDIVENKYSLRSEDYPANRRSDILQIENMVEKLGERLGYVPSRSSPIYWRDASGSIRYAFYVIASSMVSKHMLEHKQSPGAPIVLLPGGRSNLLAYKLQRDSYLSNCLASGWRFVKFRTFRWLAESTLLRANNFDQLIAQDELTYESPQLRLF